MLRKPLRRFIETYARAPYHPGKWRLVDTLLQLGRVEADERGKPTLVPRGGLQWTLDPECAVQRRLLYHGVLDIHDSASLLDRIGPGSVFFDVGSYFGYYALSAAARGAASFAFEPVPANFELLEKHVTLNPSLEVTALPLAVSDFEGEVTFNLPPAGNRGTGSMGVGVVGAGEQTAVNAVTIDSFVRERQLQRLDAMKIDVEGAELKVLAGGRQSIERFRPTMLIEVNAPCLARFGESVQSLIDCLTGMNYTVMRLHRRGLLPFENLEPGEDYTNVLSVPKETL